MWLRRCQVLGVFVCHHTQLPQPSLLAYKACCAYLAVLLLLLLVQALSLVVCRWLLLWLARLCLHLAAPLA
jgi:hypothetical protein